MHASTHRSLLATPTIVAFSLALVFLGPVSHGAAAVPADPDKQAAIIGQPTALLVQPETITLAGPRVRQQIIVTGRYADGSVRDLTPFCTLSCTKTS